MRMREETKLHRWNVIVLTLRKRRVSPERDPATSEGRLCFIKKPVAPPANTRMA